MSRNYVLALLLVISPGCMSPLTRRLDETNARLAHIEQELETANKTLNSMEKRFRIFPGGDKPGDADREAKP